MNIPHQYQLFTADESRTLDRQTIDNYGIDGFTLMEIAGTRAADFIRSIRKKKSKGLVLCGRGNNAGDALVVSRILAEHNFLLSIVFVDGDENLSHDCEKNYQLLTTLNAMNVEFKHRSDAFKDSYDFLIDGMVGTGLTSDVRTPYIEVIQKANELDCIKFAMDIPSGLHADNGIIQGIALQCDYTLAFGTYKFGYYQNAGFDYCGEIIFCELPFPSILKKSTNYLLHSDWLKEVDLHKKKRTHKYDGGVVYIIAGSEGLTGAAILASLSAWNTGVGAVILITPKGLLPIYDEHLIHIIKKPVGKESDKIFSTTHWNEIEGILSEKPGVLLIGPGLGRDANTITCTQQILSSFSGEAVIDADALFALANLNTAAKPKNARWVLTPHIGELTQLINENTSRLFETKKLSSTLNVVVVSKGLPSIINSPNGTSISTDYDTRIFTRAGFGDVLAGKIAGYLLLLKNRELACCLALSDGKTKAHNHLKKVNSPIEPIHII